ncbi:hypothetical protein GCM10009827_062840 [Dactylosporangium maewongense]|uniref:GGDEF domain-containing protein n=1 Tax=Dactylosporangium maewongense TaxID=634393 RepID=A0ABN2BAN9_9ACTN
MLLLASLTRVRWMRVALGVHLTLSVVALAALASGRLAGSAGDVVAALAGGAADASAAVACQRVARRLPPAHPARRFWHVITAAATPAAAGNLAGVVFPLGLAAPWLTEAAPSLAGIGALLAVAVMLTYPLRLRGGRDRLCFWLDLATVMVGAVAYSGYFAVPASGPAGVDFLRLLTGPVPLLVTVFAVAKLLLAGRPPFTAATGVLGGAAAGAGGLTAVLWTTAVGSGHAGWITALSVGSDCLLMVAAWVQCLQVAADPDALERPRRRPYSFLPYVALSGTLALLTGALVDHDESGRTWLVLASVAVSTGLVVLRQLTAFADNARLVGELDTTVRELRSTLAERDALAARLHDMAFQDGLTGLANRALLHDRLAARLAEPVTAGKVAAVLLVDLDDFKPVNDSFGHAAGDAVLREVAVRLRAAVGDGDTVARIGGDEFAVLVHEVDPDGLQSLARQLVTALCAPIGIVGGEARVGASIGVTVVGDDATDVEQVLREADLAMYRAKSGGKSRHAVYEMAS